MENNPKIVYGFSKLGGTTYRKNSRVKKLKTAGCSNQPTFLFSSLTLIILIIADNCKNTSNLTVILRAMMSYPFS